MHASVFAFIGRALWDDRPFDLDNVNLEIVLVPAAILTALAWGAVTRNSRRAYRNTNWIAGILLIIGVCGMLALGEWRSGLGFIVCGLYIAISLAGSGLIVLSALVRKRRNCDHQFQDAPGP